MKPNVWSIVLLFILSVPLQADLRYRTRADVRTAVAELKTLAPTGEALMLIRGDAIRIEQVGGAIKSVLLIRPDGRFVLNPEARTYARISGVQLDAAAKEVQPAFRRTGQFTTILGLQAERVEVSMSLPRPVTSLPGVPAVIPMAGELWVADAHRAYTNGINRAMGSSISSPPGIEGIVLRQIVRNSQFGLEIEHVVTEIVETDLDPALFEVPDGYRSINVPASPR